MTRFKTIIVKVLNLGSASGISPVTMSAAATEAKMNRANVVTPKTLPVIGCGISAVVRHGSELE